MGITYCRGCGTRLGHREAADPQAVVTASGAWCARCSTFEKSTLPANQQKEILKATLKADLATPRPQRRGPPRATRRTRRVGPRGSSSSLWILILLVVGAAAALGLVALGMSR